MGRTATTAEAASAAGETIGRAPRICHLSGDDLARAATGGWSAALADTRALGFSHVCLTLFPTALDPLLVTDLDAADPRLALGESAVDAAARLAALCRDVGLELALDIVLDRLAAAGPSARATAALFEPLDPPVVDPRQDTRLLQAAIARRGVERQLAAWWADRLARLVEAGVAGFRLLGLEHVGDETVRLLTHALPARATLWAWTPGLAWERHGGLAGARLDGVFASTAWWDGRAAWYAQEYASLRRAAPVIGTAGVPFERPASGREARRRALSLAAATGCGILMPAGWRDGLEEEIARATALTGRLAPVADGVLRPLTAPDATVSALVRLDGPAVSARRGVAILVNHDPARRQKLAVGLDPVDPAAGALLGEPRTLDGRPVDGWLAPGEIAVAVLGPVGAVREPRRQDRRLATAAAGRSPVVIDRVTPQVAGGPFAVKRLIGRPVVVEADIFADGHDVLAADLLWRAADEKDWQRVPMTALVNDRWTAWFTPRRIGRHLFAVEAWRDEYASLCHALEVKQRAGVDVAVEIADARAHLERVEASDLLARLAEAGSDPAQAVELLTAPETRRRVAASDDRGFACRHDAIPLDVERPQAEFASWYELFPRSLGTFDDVAAALPRIRDMGFDVLYFPPIHPIGTSHRKGRNNALVAAPDDPGSPYAIGGAEGGHDAIHPGLGTAEDFRRLVAAARDHGLEIALDFAIQCSPDHPWLAEHPEWFRRRADGSIRFAENPPKKYEDIVNVDFYAEGAVPELWLALRNVVLHWAGEGVKIFRVDNPHTKPLPFWEWMIGDVRARHPDVIFLSEAFTRPAMMYRLAKVGFTQSYTYFTWRTGKAELMDYLRELTTTEIVDYFRPNFFVNTPDINPVFLQQGGRAGFLIRACLAATLSGLWGVYSGFELCEAAALPGREEYLDSEKYEVRRRDFDAPSNIVAEIGALNRLRRSHPALQSHRGVTFYNAFNDQVLVYGKSTPAHDHMVLVAVSLDPHAVQEASFEVPLWEWQLPDDGAVEGEELMSGRRFTWHGKVQRVRLDPAGLPFAIWRIAPLGRRAGGRP
ncbi:MAG: alpha-1,4-glucan--maltose-1-phosphate maltosyltransferase [Reyranellaceae bacterium]